MSAAEIIEQIKALPVIERAEVAAFVQQFAPLDAPRSEGPRTVSPDVFTKAKAAVFQKHDEVLRRLAL